MLISSQPRLLMPAQREGVEVKVTFKRVKEPSGTIVNV